MHDPEVVAFSIPRPWPQRRRAAYTGKRYWPELICIWHVEPGGRDSGSVCKHWQDGKVRQRWKWHVWHWRIQVRPIQKLRRLLFERCAECGRGYPYGYAPIGTWGGDKTWHHECSSMGRYRSLVEEDERVIRHLVAALRLERDQDESEIVEWLTGSHVPDSALPFHARYRLMRMLGYERSDSYRLVRVAEKVDSDD